MELKDFIKAAVIGITSAVDELKDELKDKGVVIDPHQARFTDGINRMIHNPPGKAESLIHEVEFNLTVAEMSHTNKGGNMRLKVINAGIGSNTGIESSNTVKFSIPIVYSTKP